MSNEWIETTVGEYCAFAYGKAIKKADQKESGIPVYGSNGVYTYAESPLENQSTVIIGRKGSVGKIHLSLEPCWVSDTAFYVSKGSLEESYFVYYLLSSLGLEDMNTDAAVPGLNRNNAHRLEIKIPSCADKRAALVEPLIRLDQKILLNQQINQTLEEMAQALFKSWFVDFEPTKAKIAVLAAGGSEEDANLAAMQAISGKTAAELEQLKTQNPENYQQIYTTAQHFPAAMQDSELGKIPEGWEISPLSQMIVLTGGGTPKRSESDYWGGDIPWFSVKDAPASSDVWVVDTEEKITELGLQKSSTKLLRKGTTIVSARGTVGKLALVGNDMTMNQSCYGVLGSAGIGDFFNYFNLENAVETLKRNTHGAVFDTITQTTFETVVCVKPCTLLMDRFDKVAATLLNKIQANVLQSQNLATLRDALLPKLLSGELSAADLPQAELAQ